MSPVRIQRKRTKGWKMPPNTVSVTRPGRWGNPYTIKGAREAGYGGTEKQIAEWCVECFRDAVSGKLMFAQPVPKVDEIRRDLTGKNLACFCPLDQPCHADVLLELASGVPFSQASRDTAT